MSDVKIPYLTEQLTDENIVTISDDSLLGFVMALGYGSAKGELTVDEYMIVMQEALRRLALRDQQVTLADCRSVVEGMFQFDTDCGYLIDAQDTITALAQLPWPHGSGVNGE